ncbi:hypothetical protein BC567DRAFT_40724 [Phyllosticta citribraziliensis]
MSRTHAVGCLFLFSSLLLYHHVGPGSRRWIMSNWSYFLFRLFSFSVSFFFVSTFAFFHSLAPALLPIVCIDVCVHGSWIMGWSYIYEHYRWGGYCR